jgi:transposase InsO family protein
MGVTHIPSFGRQHYVHVVIDSHFGFVFASSRSGEATHHVHCLATCVVMGKPLHIKTDNGPGSTSTAFKAFCFSYKILHTTGIPYNPQFQDTVEWAHQTLKVQLQ